MPPKILTDEQRIEAYNKNIQRQIDFQRNKCRRFIFVLNKEKDKDIIKHIESKDNINNYLKELVKKDIK